MDVLLNRIKYVTLLCFDFLFLPLYLIVKVPEILVTVD